MKKYLTLFMGAAFLLGLTAIQAAQTGKSPWEKFYGKLESVDFNNNRFLVTNKTRNTQQEFTWTADTKFVFNKNEVGPKELILNRLLMVQYSNEGGNINVVKVLIRPPLGGRKKAQAPQE